MGGSLDLSDDEFRPGPIWLEWFAHLRDKLAQVGMPFVPKPLAANLSSDRLLEELGSGELAKLDLLVQIVREVYLHSWHTSKIRLSSSALK